MYSLTSYDLWKTTLPDDDGEAWEQYEDQYLPAATRLLVAHLTETLPSALHSGRTAWSPRASRGSWPHAQPL